MNNNNKAKKITNALKYWFMSIFHNLNQDLENENYEKIYHDAILIAQNVIEMKKLVSS